MLVTKTEEELIDEEDWELEELAYQKKVASKPLSFLNCQIDELECDLAELKGEREEIYEEMKAYQKEIDAIYEKREKREFQKYLKIPWYKSLITENQTTLDLWVDFNLENSSNCSKEK